MSKSSKNDTLPVPASTGRSLQRAKSLLKLTDSILGGDRSLGVRNAWLDELIAWADENGIAEDVLPRDADKILALKVLDLAQCELSCIPNSIGSLANLEELFLDGNNLSMLPESIGELTNLTWLSLHGNNLSMLPESIGELTNLTWLSLHGNNLAMLPNSIWGLTNLECLSLWDNDLPSVFSDYNSLNSQPLSKKGYWVEKIFKKYSGDGNTATKALELVAKYLGVSGQTAMNYYTLTVLPEDLKDMVDRGALPTAVARSIVKNTYNGARVPESQQTMREIANWYLDLNREHRKYAEDALKNCGLYDSIESLDARVRGKVSYR